MLCYVMLCYVMLCYVMLCYVMLCYVMLCYVMLCYVMLCYVMLYFSPVSGAAARVSFNSRVVHSNCVVSWTECSRRLKIVLNKNGSGCVV